MTQRQPAQALGWQCPWCPHRVITIVGSNDRLADQAHAEAITEHTRTHVDERTVQLIEQAARRA